MKKSEAVRQGAEHLWAAELAVDQAFTKTAGLAGQLTALRIEARMSAVVGQEAIDEVAEAITALATARRALVRAHGALADVRDRFGCGRTVGNGGMDKEPTPAPVTQHLQVVADGRAA